jgi:hypothetical protein
VLALKGFGGANLRCMKKFFILTALPLLILPGLAQSPACLRVMTTEELARQSILIARVKVNRVEKVRYRGEFSQLGVLNPVDVIEGDFTLKELNVVSRSSVRCAEDNYIKGDEMLVFLEPQESLFHTVNYQYGQFPIVGDIVKGWRDKENKPCDKPYSEVRIEIQVHINAAHAPKPEGEQPQPPKPAKPPLP